jgi:integrase/recombinase XerD
MSRRARTPDTMLPLDFGSPVIAIVDVVEPAPAPALESMVSSVDENDQRLIDMWLHGKSLHTQRCYKRAAEHFLASVVKPLRAVTLSDFQAFTDTLQGKASSRRQVLAYVKALLSYGSRLGVLPVNVGPALAVIKTPNTLADRILSETEVARMLACSDGRDHLLVRLLYAGGLRVSELLGVKWSNVSVASDGTAYIAVCGKGGKSRTVRVTQATAALLLAHRAAAAVDTYVFAGRNHALDPSQAWRIVRKVAERAGIEKSVSPHFMRHSHATHAIDRGVKITTVRDTLGHSSIAVTDRYAHARPADSSGLSLAV